MGDDSGEGLIKMLLDSSQMEPRGHFRPQNPSNPNLSSAPPNISIGSTSHPTQGNTNNLSANPLNFQVHHNQPQLHPSSETNKTSSANIPNSHNRLVSLIQLDHSYAKAWRPEHVNNILPTRSILLAGADTKKSFLPTSFLTDDDEFINVDEEPLKPVPQYDPQYARKMMTECEKFAVFANPEYEEDTSQNFEENIPKDGWTHQQKILYSRLIRVLHQDHLSRLANEGRDNEPILRRIAVDKAAKRARLVLSSYPTLWDIKAVQWLHTIFVEYLPKSYLAGWLDILQTLRSKIPKLIDKVMAPFIYHSSDDKVQKILADGLALLLRRPWDPAAKSISRRKLEQLPGNPVIIVAPPGPGDTQLMPKRLKLWNNQLGCLGKVIVINIPIPQGEARLRTTINQYLQQMVTSTIAKVRETKINNADRPVILMGWGPGASIITHVATIEKVAGIVCLGFPSTTLLGKRGELGDPLLDLRTPTLFVIGDKATNSCSDDIEDFREKITVETGLIVVGSADHNLRVSKRKKRLEGITQTMVDRNLMDEIRTFLAGVLTHTGTKKANYGAHSQFSVKFGSGSEVSPRKITGGSGDHSASSSPRKLSNEGSGAAMTAIPGCGVGMGAVAASSGTLVTPRKVQKGRKRNSSATSTDSGVPAQISPGKRGQLTALPPLAGSTSGGQADLTNKMTPGHQPPKPKRPRKPRKTSSIDTAASSGNISTMPQVVGGTPAASLRGVAPPMNSGPRGYAATQFPPGLLSISSPLPQSTLMAQSSALAPPQIRLPGQASDPPSRYPSLQQTAGVIAKDPLTPTQMVPPASPSIANPHHQGVIQRLPHGTPHHVIQTTPRMSSTPPLHGVGGGHIVTANPQQQSSKFAAVGSGGISHVTTPRMPPGHMTPRMAAAATGGGHVTPRMAAAAGSHVTPRMAGAAGAGHVTPRGVAMTQQQQLVRGNIIHQQQSQSAAYSSVRATSTGSLAGFVTKTAPSRSYHAAKPRPQMSTISITLPVPVTQIAHHNASATTTLVSGGAVLPHGTTCITTTTSAGRVASLPPPKGAVSNIPAVLPPGRFTTPVPTSQLQSLPHQQSASKITTFAGSSQQPPQHQSATRIGGGGIQLPTAGQQVATKVGAGHQYVARKSAPLPCPPVTLPVVPTSQVQKIDVPLVTDKNITGHPPTLHISTTATAKQQQTVSKPTAGNNQQQDNKITVNKPSVEHAKGKSKEGSSSIAVPTGGQVSQGGSSSGQGLQGGPGIQEFITKEEEETKSGQEAPKETSGQVQPPGGQNPISGPNDKIPTLPDDGTSQGEQEQSEPPAASSEVRPEPAKDSSADEIQDVAKILASLSGCVDK